MSTESYEEHPRNEHCPISSISDDEKAVADPELQDVFKASKLDEEAVMKIIQKKPSAAKAKYHHRTNFYHAYSPLHIAIERNASFNLVNFLHRTFPKAAKEKINCYDETALHWACRFSSSNEGVSLLLETYPQSATLQSSFGRTPLHDACINGAPTEIVSLLLESYPEAAKIQDKKGKTPLHHASSSDSPTSLRVIELLLKTYPAAVLMKDFSFGMTPLHHVCEHRSKVALIIATLMLEKHPEASMVVDNEGNTPLHTACTYSLSAKMLSFLLEKYPFAVSIKNNEGDRPIDLWGKGKTNQGTMMLTYVGPLVTKSVDQAMATEIIKDFVQIKWWGGVVLVFDLYPPIFEAFEGTSLSIMPSLLTMMGRRCKMLTVWNMLVNRQDILKIH